MDGKFLRFLSVYGVGISMWFAHVASTKNENAHLFMVIDTWNKVGSVTYNTHESINAYISDTTHISSC